MIIRLPAYSLLLSLTCGLLPLRAAEERPPNFIVIFCDDMGYADIGPFGAEGYETPHLDRVAREGMRFTDFYVGRSFCTPSRAALMTGCIPTRVGIGGNFGPHSQTGLNPDEMTIAEVLKQKGYATACYGKWHLGHQPRFLPPNQGFDEQLQAMCREVQEGKAIIVYLHGINWRSYLPAPQELEARCSMAVLYRLDDGAIYARSSGNTE